MWDTDPRRFRVRVLRPALLQFAIRKGCRIDNPAKGVRYYREAPRERYLTPDETARLAPILAAAEGRESPFALAAFLLTVHPDRQR